MNSILETLQQQRQGLEKARVQLEEAERVNEQTLGMIGGTSHSHSIPARPPQKATAARSKTPRTAAKKQTPKVMTAGA
jgi:hypothetical protein